MGQVAADALHRRRPPYRMTLMISVMQMQVQMQCRFPLIMLAHQQQP